MVPFHTLRARFAVRNLSSNLKSWPKHSRNNWTPKVPEPPKLDHAGDLKMLSPMKNIDPSAYRSAVSLSRLIGDSDALTQKLCSLQYAPERLATEYIMEDVVSKFERYPGDVSSLEVKIAKATVYIRRMAILCTAETANKLYKVRLLKTIIRRHALFADLREQNYERFQYCLKQLEIRWLPKPATKEETITPTKRELVEGAVVAKAEALKNDKFNVLREKFDVELTDLLKTKGTILANVAKQMQLYGVTLEDIFVRDAATQQLTSTVKPVDLEAKQAAEEEAKWQEAEQKNLVRWLRMLRRPQPTLGSFTSGCLSMLK